MGSDPKRKTNYIPMSEIADTDYKNFISAHNEILIEDVKIPIGKAWKVKELQPEKFNSKQTLYGVFQSEGTGQHIT